MPRKKKSNAHKPIESPMVMIDSDNWKAKALCRSHPNPELWYPASRRDSFAAKVICGRCPVQRVCLAQALLSHEDWGTWGGQSEWDREERCHRERRNYERAGRPRFAVERYLDAPLAHFLASR